MTAAHLLKNPVAETGSAPPVNWNDAGFSQDAKEEESKL
jgi:hypothetical protein